MLGSLPVCARLQGVSRKLGAKALVEIQHHMMPPGVGVGWTIQVSHTRVVRPEINECVADGVGVFAGHGDGEGAGRGRGLCKRGDDVIDLGGGSVACERGQRVGARARGLLKLMA